MQIPYFERWHPLLALRYLPVVKLIDRQETVLEVGSGSLGIGPYLRREFTGVDVGFSGPDWPRMKKVLASATDLPFSDNDFDVVISMDMLEHLKPTDRMRAIKEMVRVSRHKLIVGVPVGNLSHQQDKRLDKLYLKVHGKRHQFLAEQTSYGLPSIAKLSDYVSVAAREYGRKYELKVMPNLNLGLREWMMRGWVSQNPIINLFHRKMMLLAIPWLKKFNQPPAYRQILVVNFT